MKGRSQRNLEIFGCGRRCQATLGTLRRKRKRRSTRGSVATACGRRPGRLLKHLRYYLILTSVPKQLPPVLSSDRHILRYVVDCRVSARGNLHKGLDLAARRPADLAHPFAALLCPCTTGCGFNCAPGKVRTDKTFGVFCETPFALVASTLDLPKLPNPVGSLTPSPRPWG
eukprot:6173053-Pleurochrysis_carterae.AAC.9